MVSVVTVHSLSDYINRINELNDFDLAWHWYGNANVPQVEVFEKEERHTLAIAPIEEIIEKVRASLNHWHLVDPDA